MTLLTGEFVTVVLGDVTDPDVVKSLIRQLISQWNNQRGYFAHFAVSQVLSLGNCLGLLYLIDHLCDGILLNYGPMLWNMVLQDPQERSDPLIQLFPQVAKCTFQRYGPSGSPEDLDSLCVLNNNWINEKIFVIVTTWLFVLAALSALQMVFGMLLLVMGFCPSKRFDLFFDTTSRAQKNYRLVRDLSRKSNIADWFILYLIEKNMPQELFNRLLEGLDEQTQKIETIEV